MTKPERPTQPVKPKIGESRLHYQLPNDLTVVLEPSKAAPVVAIQAWIRVGSADETSKEAGLAHFHEHMLFKGTKHRGVGEIARDIEGFGGHINAWTSYDETVYHITMPADAYRLGIEILSDVLQYSSFAQEEVAKEAEVILEEIKRSEDIPSQKLSQTLFSQAFQTHTYSRPIIGYAENVQNFRRADLLRFYRKWYVPNNITLVVAGDFDLDEAKDTIHQHFHTFAAGELKRKRPQEPPQTKMRLHTLRDDTQESYVQLGFHIPGIHDADLYALDVLAMILGSGESSRLDTQLRRKQQLVNYVSSYAYTPIDTGLFIVSAAMPPGRERDAIDAIWKEIARIQAIPPSQQEVQKARTFVESDAIYNRETMQGLARTLGFYQAITGDLSFEEKFFEGIANVRPADIQKVAQRYLQPDQATVVFLAPHEASFDPATIQTKDLKAQHTAHQKHFNPPALKRRKNQRVLQHTLSNGVRLILKENHHAPLVSLRAAMSGGLRYETARNNGISNLCARLLNRGTPHYSAEHITNTIDEMASSLSGFSGRNSIGLQGDFLKQFFEPGLELFLDSLLYPSFPTEELQREKYFMLEDLRAQEDDIAGKTLEAFNRALFRKHPYRFPAQGTPKTVQKLSRNQLQSYYSSLLHPENLVLAVVGDFDSAQMLHLLDKKLSKLPDTTWTPPTLPLEEAPKRIRKRIQHKDRQQAHVVLGFLGTTLYDPDRYAFEVINALLSGQGGRLFLHLRDELSLAYSVSSFSLELIEPGYFAVYIGTSPQKVDTAIAAILQQLKRLQDEPVSKEELDRVKRYLRGSHAISLQRNGSQAFTYALHELYNQGIESVAAYPKEIAKVTPKQIQRIAQTYFPLKRYTLAITQPAPETP